MAGCVLLRADGAHARDDWADRACERARTQGRTWVEFQCGNEVCVLDCIGEIIEIDEDDPFPGEPGGSGGPGGPEPGEPGPGGPGGGPGGGTIVEDCARCRRTADRCKAAAHAFRALCNNTGLQFAHRTCAGWGAAGPQSCDGSDWPELGGIPDDDYLNQCLLLNIDANLRPIEREICTGPRVDRCVHECINGRPGGSHTFTLQVPVAGYERTIDIDGAAGFRAACAAASQSQAISCAAAEAQCLSKNKCALVSYSTAAGGGGSAAGRLSAPVGQAGAVLSISTQRLAAKAAARQWYEQFVGESDLAAARARRFAALIARATTRYAQLRPLKRPNRALTGDATIRARRPSRAGEQTAADSIYTAIIGRSANEAEPRGTERPGTTRRIEDAKSLPGLDRAFIHEAFALLTGRQEQMLVATWPGGQLIFGSRFLRQKR